MVEGAEKLEAEGLLDLTVVQQDSGATSEQIAQIVTDLAEDGNQLIVGHSFNYGEPIKGIIADYPDVLFAYAGGFGDITENLADYSQPFYEGAFLSGILAGDLTESGILAGTAGFEIPVCKAQIESFADGARLTYQAKARSSSSPHTSADGPMPQPRPSKPSTPSSTRAPTSSPRAASTRPPSKAPSSEVSTSRDTPWTRLRSLPRASCRPSCGISTRCFAR